MKSRMAWKPPPIFRGNNNCSHDCINTIERSILKETRRRQHSIAWKPPINIMNHPSIIVENEDEEDKAIERTSKEMMSVLGTNDVHSDIDICKDKKLNAIAAPKMNNLIKMDNKLVAIADESRKSKQKAIVETFRPFRKEIARYVANKFKANDININRESLQSKNYVTINEIKNEESVMNFLMAAMEDKNMDHRDDLPVFRIPRTSLNDKELFSFWEGTRISVCACARLVDILHQQPLENNYESSFPSSLLPPHIAQTPRKFRSIRAMSIARTKKQYTTNESTNNYEVSTIEEKKDDPERGSMTKQPRRSQSLRAMSIARIRQETIISATDTSTRTTESASNGNREIKKEEVQKIQKLLAELEEAEKYQRRLEQQLKKAGVVIAEDIPYDLAKQKVAEIALKMSELHDKSHSISISKENKIDTEAEYFKLEKEMEKYITALELTEEWIEEQAEEERKWEEAMEVDNKRALKMVLRHMPVNVKNQSERQLKENPTPNGMFLPRSIAQKFKRTNCLQLLRIDPKEMIAWHPSMFENLRVTGLTLTERRALHHHLKAVGHRWKELCTGGGDKNLERKLVWFETLKSNFRENLCAYERHINMYGPPGNHPYATSPGSKGCPMIGKQCPLKADKMIDYSGDYGYTEDSIYFKHENMNSIQSNGKSGSKYTEETPPTKAGLVTEIPSRGGGSGTRGQLLSAIHSRGGGERHCGRGRGGSGRGQLLEAIHGRGKGERRCGRVRGGVDGGKLLDAIHSCGRGERDCGRGGLLTEIKDRDARSGKIRDLARGRSDAGGRGHLLAATQARRY